jgi:hypothetical protein
MGFLNILVFGLKRFKIRQFPQKKEICLYFLYALEDWAVKPKRIGRIGEL